MGEKGDEGRRGVSGGASDHQSAQEEEQAVISSLLRSSCASACLRVFTVCVECMLCARIHSFSFFCYNSQCLLL